MEDCPLLSPLLPIFPILIIPFTHPDPSVFPPLSPSKKTTHSIYFFLIGPGFAMSIIIFGYSDTVTCNISAFHDAIRMVTWRLVSFQDCTPQKVPSTTLQLPVELVILLHNSP